MENEKIKEEVMQDNIQTVLQLMRSLGITPDDLPEVKAIKQRNSNNLESYCDMLEVGKELYDEMVKGIGKKAAYSWAEEHISSYYRTEMEIFPYRRYKVVDVSITCQVAVPYSYGDSDVQDVVANLDLYHNGDWDFSTDSDDVEESDLGHFDYVNNVDDFSDCDFDE